MSHPVPPAPVIPINAPMPLDLADLNDGDDNPYKLVNRYRKARKLADMLVREGFTEVEVAGQRHNETGRKLAANLAGTNTPSEVTWALVEELVREHFSRAEARESG